MAFNSLTFLIFITLFGLGWIVMKDRRMWRYAYITVASLIFYGWWDWRFLFLLVGTGLVDYMAGIAMERTQHKNLRRLILTLSLTSNLGALSIFKYSGFIARNVDAWLGTALADNIPAFTLILPVGISFYTFQSMSYTIDVYRRTIKPTHNLLHFLTFLALFPQLVAGPIIRASQLLWQLEKTPHTTESQRFTGLKLIVLGYAQKLLIANHLAGYVDHAFANPQASAGTGFWWSVMIAFAVQIYCDFAGYSNIARGLLKWMGIGIKPNFRFPYFSIGFRDFWNRWHISLSHWFRDYVYIPMGGSRMSRPRQHLALWTTFLLSGIWHGANWTFLVWGGLHAAYLSFERMTRWPARLPKAAAMLVTFLMAVVAWVFFRAANFTDAWHIIANMLAWTPADHVRLHTPWAVFAMFLALELYVLRRPLRHMARTNAPAAHRIEWLILGLALSVAIMFRGPGHGFIYFQF